MMDMQGRGGCRRGDRPGKGLAIQSSPGKPLAHLVEGSYSVAPCPLCKLLSAIIGSDVTLL